MVYIHPTECIDCEACVPECPVHAIYHEEELPEEWIPFRDLNATMSRQLSAMPTRRIARFEGARINAEDAGDAEVAEKRREEVRPDHEHCYDR
jgi:ferredoxin